MDRLELHEALDALGVRREVYSLTGGMAEETFCLDAIGSGSWVVYYSERGERANLRSFASENAACAYMYEVLSGDPTVTISYVPPMVPPWDR